MQPICRSSAPAAHLGPTRQVRVTARSLGGAGDASAWRRAAVLTPSSLRRPCARVSHSVGAVGSGGATEPVPAAAQSVVGETRAEVEVVAEVLESLEEAAIAGEDEGRRPTDYDRRAHIFEESSRVFRELKHRRDDDGCGGGDDGVQQGGTREPHRLG